MNTSSSIVNQRSGDTATESQIQQIIDAFSLLCEKFPNKGALANATHTCHKHARGTSVIKPFQQGIQFMLTPYNFSRDCNSTGLNIWLGRVCKSLNSCQRTYDLFHIRVTIKTEVCQCVMEKVRQRKIQLVLVFFRSVNRGTEIKCSIRLTIGSCGCSAEQKVKQQGTHTIHISVPSQLFNLSHLQFDWSESLGKGYSDIAWINRGIL